jgi:hypothetical protein
MSQITDDQIKQLLREDEGILEVTEEQTLSLHERIETQKVLRTIAEFFIIVPLYLVKQFLDLTKNQ